MAVEKSIRESLDKLKNLSERGMKVSDEFDRIETVAHNFAVYARDGNTKKAGEMLKSLKQKILDIEGRFKG